MKIFEDGKHRFGEETVGCHVRVVNCLARVLPHDLGNTVGAINFLKDQHQIEELGPAVVEVSVFDKDAGIIFDKTWFFPTPGKSFSKVFLLEYNNATFGGVLDITLEVSCFQVDEGASAQEDFFSPQAFGSDFVRKT